MRTILDVTIPVKPVCKVRATAKSWHARARRYKPFRDSVRFFIRETGEPAVENAKVTIQLDDWSWKQDPDNVVGGILDCLKPWPLPDDSMRFIKELHVKRSDEPMPGEGFRVIVQSLP